MISDLEDTIVALSSAPGIGRRAIVRVSGSGALRCAARRFSTADDLQPGRRRMYVGALALPGVAGPLPCDLYVWPAPRTYTGQELVELHTMSSPPLVDLLIAQLLNAGCRAARPGEFTLRAFLAGKLDLPRAEAILGVIEAADRDELKDALVQLAGGVTRPLHALREDLLDLLAEVEAGLDFAEEDLQFVGRRDLLDRLARGLAQVTLLEKQLARRGMTHRSFRIVLAGRPNAGKSSLFNALVQDTAALVSAQAGTTRDYLVGTLRIDNLSIELVDTAGWQQAAGGIEQQAQHLGREQVARADLILLCLEAGQQLDAEEQARLARPEPPRVLAVATKCDLAEPAPDLHATSSMTGAGIAALRELLAKRAQAQKQPALAPSLSRCQHHVAACLDHLRRAHGAVLFEEPAEILALELRSALDQLGEMVGAVYTDDLLDRIFSRFCIGK